MVDIKFIRDNPHVVRKALEDRASKISIDDLLRIDDERRKLLTTLEDLRATRNKANDEISTLLKAKQDAKEKIASMKATSEQIKKLEESLKCEEERLDAFLLTIPNIPHESVPVGEPEKAQIVKTWGSAQQFDFTPRTHIELAQHLDIIDFPRGTKITGSNFILYEGWGATLERALFNFMLDVHTRSHGYTEVFPPFLVNRRSMLGTGQLPKLEDDMYKLKDDDLFLIPTAEVPVTNMYRDDILEESQLPIYATAYTPCFRREAGSYGKDTKGLIRVHQFDKVELVKFVKPDTSYAEHEKLLTDAEEILQMMGFMYRVKLLSTQDLSFSASKCYDLEVYAPGMQQWLEVSSCSNFEAFQARRANIRYRREDTKKLEYLHTLNGSGVALARTVIALLENYQQKDGSVAVPPPLRPYLHGKERIEKSTR